MKHHNYFSIPSMIACTCGGCVHFDESPIDDEDDALYNSLRSPSRAIHWNAGLQAKSYLLLEQMYILYTRFLMQVTKLCLSND